VRGRAGLSARPAAELTDGRCALSRSFTEFTASRCGGVSFHDGVRHALLFMLLRDTDQWYSRQVPRRQRPPARQSCALNTAPACRPHWLSSTSA
jgi:hypothetical protein